MKIILFFIIVNVFTYIRSQDKSEDDLEINILPSDKYRLSKRDLLNLKSDLERQMMQRVYEIQSSWDQRRKLRHFALRPPMQPSLPYKSPVYNPNLFSLFAKPSHDGTREMKTLNNPGFTGYSFSQKLKKKKDSELDPVEILKQQDEKDEQQKKKLMDEIDKKFDLINKEKEKEKIALPAKILGEEIKNNKNSTSIIKSDIIDSDSNTRKNDKTYSELDEKQKLKNRNDGNDSVKEKQTQIQTGEQTVPPGLDYNSIADVLSKMFEKLNKKIDKSKILGMIHGKDKDQIMQLVSFIKDHPDSVMLPVSKNENPKKIDESSYKKNDPVKIAENKKEFSNDKKFFKSVSPFDSEGTEKPEKDETGIKYKTQARFLSTNTEIKTPINNYNESLDTNDRNKNSKSTESNSKNQLEKESNLSQPKEQASSQFMFQDGPINLDIF